jgi:hypothetical protein
MNNNENSSVGSGKKPKKLVFVSPKDAARILGRSEAFGRKAIRDIKEVFNKKKHMLVSVTEFCIHFGLKEDDVITMLHY